MIIYDFELGILIINLRWLGNKKRKNGFQTCDWYQTEVIIIIFCQVLTINDNLQIFQKASVRKDQFRIYVTKYQKFFRSGILQQFYGRLIGYVGQTITFTKNFVKDIFYNSAAFTLRLLSKFLFNRIFLQLMLFSGIKVTIVGVRLFKVVGSCNCCHFGEKKIG